MKKFLFAALALLCITGALSAQEKWYDVKSGILKSVCDDGTTKTDITTWFDDFGDKQTTHQITHMPGDMGDVSFIIVFQGNKMFSINDYKKESMESDRPKLNWINLPEKAIKDFKIEEVGKETVLGRECTVFTYQEKQLMRMVTVKVWTWKGFVLKSEMRRGKRAVVTEPVSFTPNASIPSSTFDPKTYLK